MPLRETVTRNHTCQSTDELLREVCDWFQTARTFPIETSLYQLAAQQWEEQSAAADQGWLSRLMPKKRRDDS